MKDLTDKQKEVLAFVECFIKQHSYPPTVREIGDAFKFSPNAAQDHLVRLVNKGYIKRHGKESRGIEVIKNSSGRNLDFEAVPIVGTIAAGQPIMSEENIDDYIRVDNTLLQRKKGRQYFALRVRGNSMVNAGVMDGDTAVLEKCESAKNRDIVAAWVEDSVTLKRYFREKNRVRLEAENPDFKPIYSTSVRIEGRLVAVLRRY